jgi:uncharacterized membrane protein
MHRRFNVIALSAFTGALVLGTPLVAAASPAQPQARPTQVNRYTNNFSANTKGWCNFSGATCDGAANDYGTIVRTK